MDLADIRIKEHFGLVTNDTSTTQLSFLVSPPKNRESIEKQNIICFNHPNTAMHAKCWLKLKK